jgi:hypothetical protein
VVDNKERLMGGFEELSSQFIQQPTLIEEVPVNCAWFIASNIVLLTKLPIEFDCALVCKIDWQFHLQSSLQSAHEIDLFPFLREVDIDMFVLAISPLDNRRSIDLNRNLVHQPVSELHHPPIIRKRAVQFTAGKLRVVCLVNALISEILANFENLHHPAHHQFLEIQLGSDSEEQVCFVVVVKSDEWFLYRAQNTAIAPPQLDDKVGVYTST